ncbi:MAG: hypothetical protein ACRC62_35270 [Microcoleus sp.]
MNKRRKKEEGRRKREEGRGKKEEAIKNESVLLEGNKSNIF